MLGKISLLSCISIDQSRLPWCKPLANNSDFLAYSIKYTRQALSFPNETRENGVRNLLLTHLPGFRPLNIIPSEILPPFQEIPGNSEVPLCHQV